MFPNKLLNLIVETIIDILSYVVNDEQDISYQNLIDLEYLYLASIKFLFQQGIKKPLNSNSSINIRQFKD